METRKFNFKYILRVNKMNEYQHLRSGNYSIANEIRANAYE